MVKIIALTVLFIPILVQSVSAASDKESNPYIALAIELLKDCEGKDKVIAVTRLSYSDGRDSRDGEVVTERITTELVRLKKLRVIERKEIGNVLNELKLQRSGSINYDSAKEIGRMLGADWVVVGTLTELADKELELNTRLVGVESGEIITAASAHVERDWLDQYKKLLLEEDKVIKKNNKNAQAFYEKGVIYTDLKEYDNAIANFGKAIQFDPALGKAYYGRAKAYIFKDDYGKAIEDCSKAISIAPKSSGGYTCRGSAYFWKGDYDKAIENCSLAIDIDPKDIAAYFNRGYAYDRKGEYDKVIEDCSKIIAMDAMNAAAYTDRGYAYLNKHEIDKAIEDLSIAIAIDPETDRAYVIRSLCYAQRPGGYDIAIQDCSKAIAINPKSARAYSMRALFYRKTGRHKNAAADEEKYRSLGGK